MNFIQIGAFTGITQYGEDIIWPIVRKNQWNGIFIEPIPSAFEKLVENYSDLTDSYFENVAIMNYDGEVDLFYEAHGDLRIASTNPAHSPGRNMSKMTVPCMRLETLIDKYSLRNQSLELLQIDTEGRDSLILLDTDFSDILIKQIRFEHCHLGCKGNPSRDEVIKHLQKFGYVEVEDIYHNSLDGEKGIDTLMERKND